MQLISKFNKMMKRWIPASAGMTGRGRMTGKWIPVPDQVEDGPSPAGMTMRGGMAERRSVILNSFQDLSERTQDSGSEAGMTGKGGVTIQNKMTTLKNKMTKQGGMTGKWIPAFAGMTTRKTLRTFATRGVVFAMVLMMALSNVFMANAATYTFIQTDWSGGQSAATAVDPTNLTGWTQYATASTSLAIGTSVALTTTSTSITQTDEGATNTGFNLSGSSFSQTEVSGTGASASVLLQNTSVSPGTKQIAAGNYFSCALKTDGSVMCWGKNSTGTLGDGTNTQRNIPTQVSGLTAGTVKALTAGANHTCALKTDGSVVCWGSNYYGQGGNGADTTRYIPTQVSGLTAGTVKEITAGDNHTCALKTDGSAVCWGQNDNGQIGDTTLTSRYIPTQVSGLTAGTVKGISGGTYHTCALKTDGSAVCWGNGDNGRRGDGTTTQVTIPTQVSGLTAGTVKEIVARYDHTCALKTDGSAVCWGSNTYGQMGDNTTTERLIPTQVSGLTAGTVNKIVTEYRHTCALKTDGSAVCWGYNAYGQIGDNTTTQRLVPTQVSGLTAGTVKEITGGYYHTCALKTDGSVICWGFNGNGQLGDNTTTQRLIPTQVSGLVTGSGQEKIVKGDFHTCALKNDGSVVCWGQNTEGQIGDNTTANKSIPTQVSGLTAGTVKEITGGTYHTCALKTDGSMVCWGGNYTGQIGDNTTTQRNVPTQVSGLTAGTVKEITAGATHTCALKTDGSAVCWGYNIFSQLGDSTTENKSIPTQVSGLTAGTVNEVDVGDNHSCALKTDGTMVCWGLNSSGQLGDNTTANKSIPTQVSGLTAGTVKEIMAGGYHTCALKTDGAMVCWGLNSYGQIGDNTETQRLIPTQVSGLTAGTVNEITVGYNHTCALKTDGSARCWGGNSHGQLGDSTATYRIIPTQVSSLTAGTVKEVVAGYLNACAIKTDSAAVCWGYNGQGQLGDGTLEGKYIPTQVSGLTAGGGGSVYAASGTYTSGAMDIGEISGYTTLAYTASTSVQATLTIDARSGNTATPDGTWTAWQTGIATGGSISTLGTNRYFQYQANLATSDTGQTPTLDSVSVGYSAYATNQTLTSSKYDTGAVENSMGSLIWDEDASLPTGTTITVSLGTASSSTGLDTATWYGFTSTSTNCAKVSTTVTCPSAALSSASATLTDSTDDRWYHYKVLMTSTGANAPTLPEVRVQYVVNAPPELAGVTALQIATSSDANWGKVQIDYTVRDIDTDTGSVTQGYITPSFEYTIGGGWIAIASSTLSAGATSNKLVTQVGFTAYSALWDVKTAIPGQYSASAQIRVTANDNEAANSTGTGTATAFTVDTTAPTVSGTINGTSNEISFSASDDGLVSYRISNNSDGSYDSVNASSGQWIAAGATSASATTTWVLAGAPDNQIAHLNGLDIYGNAATTTIVGPATPIYFDIKDASNVLIDNYKIFLSWKTYTATTSASFNRYELYRSTDGSSYGLQSTLTNSATNYYADSGLSSSTTYYYKLLAVDGDGDVSPYSTALSHMPSGQGGTDSTPPALSLITATDTQSTYSKVTFTTNEIAFGTIEYHAAGGSPYALSEVKSTIETSHTIVLTDLTPNTVYTYRVKATDIAGNITTDDNAGAGYTFTTRGGPIITDVTASLTDDRNATIVWNTNVDSNSTLVYAENAITLTNGINATAVQDTTFAGGAGPLYQHKIVLTSLTPRTTYYYYVQSTDADGNAGVDKNGLNYYTFTTSYDRKAPTVSAILTPVITETAVVVLWKTDELSDSQVSYGTESGTYTETTTLDTNMSIMHAVTLTGLTAATQYYYVVLSSDPAGNATTSPEKTVTSASAAEVQIVTGGGGAGMTNNPPPEVKDTTSAIISNIKVASTTAFGATLSFETSEPTVIGLRYGQTTAYDRAEASIDWKISHEIKLSGLRLGTMYHFQIKAIDKGGNEAFSDDSTFTTKFIAEASEGARTIENLQQYEQEIEDSLASILPSILPPFVEDARVTDITESAATINWRTNINSYATVSYATEEEYLAATTTRTVYTGEVSDITTKTREHSLILIGLKPNTTYHFKSKSFSVPQVVGEGRDMTFTTKAPAVQASVIDVKTTSFRAAWTTDVPASSIVEYKNLATGVIERIINEPLVTYHDILVDNLRPGTRYEVKVLGYSASGNLLSSGAVMNVLTSTDISAPKISNFKVDGALVPGRTDRIQTIVSWTTDEPGTGIVEYQEGAGSVAGGFANKVTLTDNYVTNHVVILTNLKPGTIYQFRITSADQAGNTASFGPRTIITPQKGESIFDVIFKNFEDTFKFLRGAGQ